MKYLPLFLMLLVFFMVSCTEDNNPISPSLTNNAFLGGIGTQRTFHETEIWLNSQTNLPYSNVPDSIVSKLSITKDQLEEGVHIIRDYTEVVEQIDEDLYENWELSSPIENYLKTSAKGKAYSLTDEVESLLRNEKYTFKNYGIGQEIFLITSEAIMSTYPANWRKTNPSSQIIKNSLQINDTWIQEQVIDETSNRPKIETFAQVVAKVNIEVPAGSFSAFKIKLTTYHYDPDYNFERGYEYHVPNVGLVLEEYDLDTYRYNTEDKTTIHFRKIGRKELVSYSFVQ